MNNSPDSHLTRDIEKIRQTYAQLGLPEHERAMFKIGLWNTFDDRERVGHDKFRGLAHSDIPEDISSILRHFPEEEVQKRFKLWAQQKWSSIISREAEKGYKELEINIALLCDYDEEEDDYWTQEDYDSVTFSTTEEAHA